MLAGWSAIAALAFGIGGVIAASVASIVTFFAMGGRGPFGPLNDALNAAAAVMTSLLAFSLHRQDLGGGRVGATTAVLGGGVAVGGSVLVLTNRTGWLLAGLVSALGFALLGIWLALFNRSLAAAHFPLGLRRLGVAAGAIMSLGLILLPAVATRLDDAESAPWWVWTGFLGFLGTYVLYPFWVIWFGRVLPLDREDWH